MFWNIHPCNLRRGELKAHRRCGSGMGRSSAAVWLVALLMCSFLPATNPVVPELLNETPETRQSGASGLNIAFSNGPAQDDEIKGTHAVTFSVGGTGTLASLLLEITSDESTWTTLVNLTTTPWMYPFDTTSMTNDTYKLRASGWDSDSEKFYADFQTECYTWRPLKLEEASADTVFFPPGRAFSPSHPTQGGRVGDRGCGRRASST